MVASTRRVLPGLLDGLWEVNVPGTLTDGGGCLGGVSSGSVSGRVAVSQPVLDVLGQSLGGVTVCGVAVGVAVVSLVGECPGVAVPVPQVVVARRAGVSVRSVLRWWPTVRVALAEVGVDVFDVGGGRAFWAVLDPEHPVQVAGGWAFPPAALVVGGHGGAPPGWSITDRVRSVVWWSWSTPDGVLSRDADVDGLAARAATTPGGWRRWVAEMTARGYIRGRCFDPGPWTGGVAVSTAEYRAEDRHSRYLRADPQRCGRWGGTTRWHGAAAIPEPVDLYTPAIDDTPSLYSLSREWDLSSKRARSARSRPEEITAGPGCRPRYRYRRRRPPPKSRRPRRRRCFTLESVRYQTLVGSSSWHGPSQDRTAVTARRWGWAAAEAAALETDRRSLNPTRPIRHPDVYASRIAACYRGRCPSPHRHTGPCGHDRYIRERGRRLDENLNPQTRHTPPPPPPTGPPPSQPAEDQTASTTGTVTIEDAQAAVAAAALPDNVAALFERLLNRTVPDQGSGTVPPPGEPLPEAGAHRHHLPTNTNQPAGERHL